MQHNRGNMKSLIFILFVFLTSFAFSQGKVEVIADTQLNEIAKVRFERKKIADSRPDTLTVQGYRVQVFFSNDRKKAYAIKDKVIRMYPEWADQVYVVYQSPNYKVRVGNFIKESDGKALEKLLSKNFESVFLVRDNNVRYIKNKPKENED